MHWIQSLSTAIHYIESNLTNDIGVDDVSGQVYASSAHFQRIFNLVTGLTIGDYIRSRRLSLAGQELLGSKTKIIDIAMKYRYDTQESFSKAFTRFYGMTPSAVRKLRPPLKVFRPLTINLTIEGGFDMSRKLIDHVPVHQLQYPYEGQNYVFNGCMRFIMECLGEDERYDYWFFSAVSGDCYVQVYGTDKSKLYSCYSQAKFDDALCRRVFGAVGYDYTYLAAADWHGDSRRCRDRMIESIDRGVPVIFNGFGYPGVTCVVGYENDGECFYCLPEEAAELEPFTLDDGAPYNFVFIGGKKEAPPIAEAYRRALLDALRLMRTPPDPAGDVFFGGDAFIKWADMLESGFYTMSREAYDAHNSIASWKYYCIYICILATNIFSKRHTTDRALEMNPDLAWLAPLLEAENARLAELEEQLKAAGGDFNVSYEALQDPERCREIAGILRRFPEELERICEILERG